MSSISYDPVTGRPIRDDGENCRVALGRRTRNRTDCRLARCRTARAPLSTPLEGCSSVGAATALASSEASRTPDRPKGRHPAPRVCMLNRAARYVGSSYPIGRGCQTSNSYPRGSDSETTQDAARLQLVPSLKRRYPRHCRFRPSRQEPMRTLLDFLRWLVPIPRRPRTH
jgi:hypothetical protein